MDEITQALKVANLELHNHLNIFNGLKYHKFVENVIDTQDWDHLIKQTEEEEDSDEEKSD